MAGVQRLMTLLLTVSMLWASLFVSETNGQVNACPVSCPANYDPVCGSDGRTYGNRCGFEIAKCENPVLDISSSGPCTFPTTPEPQCPVESCVVNLDPVCGSDGTAYFNECAFQMVKCRNPALYIVRRVSCTFSTGTVCGSDGGTYNNECALQMARCGNLELYTVSSGPCRPCPDCPANYDPVCGSDGTTYTNECAFQSARCRNPRIYKIYDGVCVITTTPCDTVCFTEYRPVCGSDGTTYINECELQNEIRCRNPALLTVPCDSCNRDCNIQNVRYLPTCGSDGVTYTNVCYFEVAKCRNPRLYKIYDGECVITTTECETGCSGEYNPVCGSDRKTYSNECIIENEIRCRNSFLYIQYVGACRADCVCD